MTTKAFPPVATKIPSKLDWDFNASTGSYIAQLNPVTRLVRSGRDGKFLYRAEYWGDYSFDFPIGSNALTASKALEDLKKDVAKLKRTRGSARHHATKKKSPAQLQREIDEALTGASGRSKYHLTPSSPKKLFRYTKSELEAMPTISSGHFENLKVEGEVDGIPTRWWLTRMTVEDGETHAVHVEQLVDGRWQNVHKYGRADTSSSRGHATKKKPTSRSAHSSIAEKIEAGKKRFKEAYPTRAAWRAQEAEYEALRKEWHKKGWRPGQPIPK